MKHNHSIQGASPATAAPRSTAILPLPDHVVAQIKSSTIITSLTDVVLELLKNALDAGATRIDATVDFARGGCSVEDNGRGIAPSDFKPDGGLGKLHCTSKYQPEQSCLGRNGTFLASLAAMSLVTITSHHSDFRSHNSVTFHHASSVDRQLPAHPRHNIKYDRHGTRVTVRNLFGNLPVRVKQRTAAVEHKPEHDRLWARLRREVTSLWLSWQQPVALKLRGADHKSMININGQLPTPATSDSKIRSRELQSLLSVLTQSDWIHVDEWSTWVPVSASTPAICIRGAISLEPAPTKRAQFISLGIQPLSAENGHNTLFDEVNRIFNSSSFGTVEVDAEVDEEEKVLRKTDGRFKSDGYTARQLRGRKGVDRYPMFYLRIVLKGDAGLCAPKDGFLDKDTNVQAVLEVLTAMISQWLSVHHFRRSKETSVPDSSAYSKNDCHSTPRSPSVQKRESRSALRELPRGSSQKTKAAQKKQDRIDAGLRRQQLFSDWSRIKSGRQPAHNETFAVRANGVGNTSFLLEPGARTATSTAPPEQASASPTRPIHPEVTGGLPHTSDTGASVVQSKDSPFHDADAQDETMTWTHPVTREVIILNARTGCVMPRSASKRPATAFPTEPGSMRRLSLGHSRMTKRVKTAPAETANVWLDGVLKTWDNPIFRPAEPAIRRVTLEEYGLPEGGVHGSHHCCGSKLEIAKAFNESSVVGNSKLSKDGLRNARVISQVDKKFILVKMSSCSSASGDLAQSEVLALIDQHAADERVRVEALITQLCAPPHTSDPPYRSRLRHSSSIAYTLLDKPLHVSISAHEHELFITHAARFAQWGILYDVQSSEPCSTATLPLPPSKQQHLLKVSTLPPSISERCKSDPKLAIALLRSTVWTYSESSHLPALTADPTAKTQSSCVSERTAKSETSTAAPPPWLKALSTCPQPLLDLINSRACRSAIMFNDALSLGECQDLVARLADCVFPFMCAHGRPSMVPLLEVGREEGGGVGVRIEEVGSPGLTLGSTDDGAFGGERKGFVEAWKGWKGRGDG